MKLLWLDLETTGLDPHNDEIIEVAACIADIENPFVTRSLYTRVVHYPGGPRPSCHPVVAEMHRKNGLWAECEASETSLAVVQEELIARIDPIDHTDRENQTTLAGSCVSFDLAFIRAHMPALAKYLHYRVYDVSSVALFCRSLGMPRPPKVEVHRALADVQGSIALARSCAEWLGK